MCKTTEEKRIWFKGIVERIVYRDEAALEEFYNVYGNMIFYTAKVICHNSEIADEVVDKVLQKVWFYPDKIRNYKNPDGWVYTVAKNTAKDMKPRRKFLPLNDNLKYNCDDYQKVIDDDAFSYAIKDLTENEQKIIIYKIIQQYTFEEISDILNRSVNTISASYYRSLTKIKNKIQKVQK